MFLLMAGLSVSVALGACPETYFDKDCGRDGAWASGTYGCLLGVFQGVEAYSNGNWTGGGCGKYQCVDYVRRFYHDEVGNTLGALGPEAYAVNAFASWHDNSDLTQYANGATTSPPAPGDIYCNSGHVFGHIAIIKSVDLVAMRVVICDQNRFPGEFEKELALHVDGQGRYSIDPIYSGYATQGWLRDPAYVFSSFDCAWVTQSIVPNAAFFPGQLVECQVKYKNTGSSTWHNDPIAYPESYVALASTNEAGTPYISFFNRPPDSPDPDVNWLTDKVPCTMQEASVAPGDTGTFVFTGRINLNAVPGSHKIYFGPVYKNKVLPGWGKMHFPIVVAPGWVASVPANDCSGPVDGNNQWHQPNFYPRYNQWRPQTVPDVAGWGCNDCDRFYRYWYDYPGAEVNIGASLHFASDDAIAIYVNGQFVGEWGNGCHQSGCVNGPGNCAINFQVPDVEISHYLHKGPNLISARVTDRDGGEYFSLAVNEHPLVITSKAICCLGADNCMPITEGYTSIDCQQAGGQVLVGGWFDCSTFSSCTNPQLKGKSDPALFFTTPLPLPALPAQLTFTLDESKPREAYYDLPEVLGGARLDVADFTGEFTVLAQETNHPDTVDLLITDYSFECPSVLLGGLSTGISYVRLDSSATAVHHGTYVRSSRMVDVIVQSVLFNDLFLESDPIRSRSQIHGRLNLQTGVLEAGSETYNVLPSPCVTIACGDVNGSCQIDITAAVALILYIFAGGAPPSDPQGGDVSCDGKCNIGDAVYLVNYIFASGPVPCAACP